ncbi:MAG: (d)CMP kinase, partial [Nitrospinota bacterium]
MDSGNYVIAIDGLAGSGKSTMAKLLADRLKIGYIDSGALYRAVTAFAIDNNLDIEDEQLISKIASNLEIRLDGDQIFVNGIDFKKRIRSLDVNQNVSKFATYKGVRETLSNLQ